MAKSNTSFPLYLFHEGTNYEAYKLFSPVPTLLGGKQGWQFRVWAPAAKSVGVVGDFNEWSVSANPMTQESGGIWSLFIEGLSQFDNYKYAVTDASGATVFKCDPYGLHFETAPANSSKLYDLGGFVWHDRKWISKRESANPYASPMNIYELHFGSWRRYPDGNFYSYAKMADELIPYVKKMGYTHIELMPLTEYPFEGSWGYQVTGMYAPTSRYGTPHDFMEFVDRCHRAGIGVLLDWVLAHFPRDSHGLFRFDGTPLYEYADPRKGEHKEWGTMVYDFAKPEVRSFLISAAMMWFERYHVDGLRCDAVASMLYLDYCRKDGEWLPNEFGGNYNLEARDFLKQMNTALLTRFSGALMIAEESTAYPMITKPAYDGGLGFNFKWNMGWMNDSLHYLNMDPFFRKDNHKDLTFSITYAYSENYILPISHDEVVHGKKSVIERAHGDYDQKFESLKAFYGYMFGHPGKKLNFMGGEFAQFIEWDYQKQLDWFLLEYPRHRTFMKFVKDLNAYYLANKEFWELDCSPEGFEWLVVDDNHNNVIAFERRATGGSYLICVVNFSPVAQSKYMLGVPEAAVYKTELCSAMHKYGGTESRRGVYKSSPKPMHGRAHRIKINIPANSVMFIKPENNKEDII